MSKLAPCLLGVIGILVAGCELTDGKKQENGAVIVLDPPALDFGSLAVGSEFKELQVKISNVGDRATSECGPATLIGSNAEAFAIVSDDCQGKSLAPNKSCTAVFRAAPVTAGLKTAGVHIVCDRESVESDAAALKVMGLGEAGSALFSYTGSNQEFVVPDGVTSLRVKLWGAGGEFGSQDLGNLPCENQPGGGGGFASGTLAVVPGQVLSVRVGGSPVETTIGGWPNGGSGAIDQVDRWVFGINGGGGGSSSILNGSTVVIEAGGGNGGAGCEEPVAGGGIRSCANPGNQTGASYNIAPGSGGGGYCGGYERVGGSSFVPEGGVEQAGLGPVPGNAGDADRAGAGEGGIPYGVAATAGLVKISW